MAARPRELPCDVNFAWASRRSLRSLAQPTLRTTDGRLPARLGVAHLQGGHGAADGEVAVVQEQRTRHAVLVELEFQRIGGRLLAVALGAVEITDGDGPAAQGFERAVAGGRIVRLLRAGRDRLADDGER